jgi:dihydrolipoamide dehydrogenase
VVVIGGGPGGYAAALYGASAGLDIALIEKNKIGGTCLNVGCIPAKELLESAHVHRTLLGAAEFGFEIGEVGINWTRTIERKQEVVDRLVGGLGQLLKSRKVTVFDGHGKLHAGHKVAISGGESGDVAISGDSVVIATGSLPRTIPGFDVDGEIVMTSDEFLSMDPLPVVGRGHRRWRHRLRVRLDDVRHGHRGHRSSRRCPRSSPAATPTWSGPCSSRSRSARST